MAGGGFHSGGKLESLRPLRKRNLKTFAEKLYYLWRGNFLFNVVLSSIILLRTRRRSVMLTGFIKYAMKPAYRLRRRYRELLREEITHTLAKPAQANEEMQALFSALADCLAFLSLYKISLLAGKPHRTKWIEMLNVAPNQNAASILSSVTYFLAALILAHLALAAAEILAFAAALIVFLIFLTEAAVGLALLIFAHLAFCAARIFSMPAALIFLRAVFTSVTVFVSTVPDSLINSCCSSAICSLTWAARLNCDEVR
jgi:hypothetical protein